MILLITEPFAALEGPRGVHPALPSLAFLTEASNPNRWIEGEEFNFFLTYLNKTRSKYFLSFHGFILGMAGALGFWEG